MNLVLRVAGLLLLWLGLAASAGAQGGANDSGDYQILQARYGSAERNIDVTDRLRELARLDRTFRMGNDTFGTDPDPGRAKTLRIYTRGRDGQARTFEFAEGNVIDGAQFTGWAGGGWGRGPRNGGWRDGLDVNRDAGEYRIVQALYGTAQQNVDVTQRLRELAAQDRNFVVSNAALGADPDRGRAKSLQVFTRTRNGQPRLFEFAEGGTVDGQQFTGWRGGDWGQSERNLTWNGMPANGVGTVANTITVVNASYGAGSRRIDVTDRLRSQLRGDRIDATIDNNWAGSDPARGAEKSLWLIYTVNGRLQYAEVSESGRLTLP